MYDVFFSNKVPLASENSTNFHATPAKVISAPALSEKQKPFQCTMGVYPVAL